MAEKKTSVSQCWSEVIRAVTSQCSMATRSGTGREAYDAPPWAARSACAMVRRTSTAVKGLVSRGTSLCAKKPRPRGSGYPRQENEAPTELRRVAQRPVEAGSVQFRHAQITEDQVIGTLLGRVRPAVRWPLPTVWPSRHSSRVSALIMPWVRHPPAEWHGRRRGALVLAAVGRGGPGSRRPAVDPERRALARGTADTDSAAMASTMP